MLTTIADLRNATDFERFALSSAAPPRTTNAVLELGHNLTTATFTTTSIVNVNQAEIDASTTPFRPLLFGAAWECLDLAFELGEDFERLSGMIGQGQPLPDCDLSSGW